MPDQGLGPLLAIISTARRADSVVQAHRGLGPPCGAWLSAVDPAAPPHRAVLAAVADHTTPTAVFGR